MPPDAESFEAFPEKGVVASIGGREVVVGSPRFLSGARHRFGSAKARIDTLEEAGRTVIAAATKGLLLGILALGDNAFRRSASGLTIAKFTSGRLVIGLSQTTVAPLQEGR